MRFQKSGRFRESGSAGKPFPALPACETIFLMDLSPITFTKIYDVNATNIPWFSGIDSFTESAPPLQ
jgi:hypothetical protein